MMYEIFHRGFNHVDEIKDGMLVYDFDELDEAHPLEAMGHNGDSGSGAYIDVNGTLYVAGVKSNGQDAFFGSKHEYTRVGDLNEPWITANLKSPDARVAVEECSAFPGYGESPYGDDYGDYGDICADECNCDYDDESCWYGCDDCMEDYIGSDYGSKFLSRLTTIEEDKCLTILTPEDFIDKELDISLVIIDNGHDGLNTTAAAAAALASLSKAASRTISLAANIFRDDNGADEGELSGVDC